MSLKVIAGVAQQIENIKQMHLGKKISWHDAAAQFLIIGGNSKWLGVAVDWPRSKQKQTCDSQYGMWIVQTFGIGNEHEKKEKKTKTKKKGEKIRIWWKKKEKMIYIKELNQHTFWDQLGGVYFKYTKHHF